MRDDVIEHLAAIDILAQHVPVIIGSDDISHAADVRVTEESDDSCFAGGPDFLGLVRPLLIGSALVSIFSGATGDDFAGDLAVGRIKQR